MGARVGPVRLLFIGLLAAALGCAASSGEPPPEVPAAPESLYERLGQLPRLRRWVDELAWRLAADEQIGSAFVGADLGALKRDMLQMACAVADGPCRYDFDRLPALGASGEKLARFLEVAAGAARSVEMPAAPAAELIERLKVRMSP